MGLHASALHTGLVGSQQQGKDRSLLVLEVSPELPSCHTSQRALLAPLLPEAWVGGIRVGYVAGPSPPVTFPRCPAERIQPTHSPAQPPISDPRAASDLSPGPSFVGRDLCLAASLSPGRGHFQVS